MEGGTIMAFDSNKLGDGLKKLLMAGIGAVATTAEKSQEIIDDLAKKGEITWEQSKDLQQNVRTVFEKKGGEAEELAQRIAKLSMDEVEVLKSRVADLKKMAEERLGSEDEAEEELNFDEPEEEEAPAEEAPAEEAPAEEAPAPVKKVPAEDAPTESTC
jgi:polyhydroxyalkanoate synthesis regulator phasin